MYKLLLVDDEITVRMAVKNIINWNDYGFEQIFEAENGYAGIDFIDREHPDIILVDIKMPGMNGLEFIEAAKKKWSQGLYVILSGYSDFDYAKQAIGLQIYR